jgi:hypothetical protein
VPDCTPLVPIESTDSTKPYEMTAREYETTTNQTKEPHIKEFSQEEAEFISNKLGKHEHQITWHVV